MGGDLSCLQLHNKVSMYHKEVIYPVRPVPKKALNLLKRRCIYRRPRRNPKGLLSVEILQSESKVFSAYERPTNGLPMKKTLIEHFSRENRKKDLSL